jgi:hypothetical protein
MVVLTSRQWFWVIITVVVSVTTYNVSELFLNHQPLCPSVAVTP